MTEKKRYPSDQQNQFMVRFPDGMREEIKAAAAVNNRSMNAEIIARISGQQRTIRDEFAGQAMAALIITNKGASLSLTVGAAKDAYAAADSLLKAREAQP